MRSRARAAAALAALALAAGGCGDLFSSLTPFGLGDRGPDRSEVAYSGAWEGTTSAGGAQVNGRVAFLVAGSLVGPLTIEHATAGCVSQQWTTADDVTTPITADAFSFDLVIVPQGSIVIEGAFSSADAVSGRYAFEGVAAIAGCPTSGSGSFTATKLTQP